MSKSTPPEHPGRALKRRLKLIGGLAAATRLPAKRVAKILKGKRDLTAESAARFGRFLENSPREWLLSQMEWDLWQVGHGKVAKDLARIVPHSVARPAAKRVKKKKDGKQDTRAVGKTGRARPKPHAASNPAPDAPNPE
ncbi:MAG: hypothetical protein H0W83_05030 [Planctomycetes bacterium]|nr:hypothetical protein [Planctomycetota bacterium]